MTEDRIKEILAGIRDVKIAVYGDFCLDAYWLLDPRGSEVSVETGLQARAVARHHYSLGGASNVVANLAALEPAEIRVIGVFTVLREIVGALDVFQRWCDLDGATQLRCGIASGRGRKFRQAAKRQVDARPRTAVLDAVDVVHERGVKGSRLYEVVERRSDVGGRNDDWCGQPLSAFELDTGGLGVFHRNLCNRSARADFGTNAARMALGLQADVTILDRSIDRLRELDALFGERLRTVYSNQENLEEHVLNSDMVVGAVLVPGASAPKLVTKAMLTKMKKGSVLVDVAIDQGGCFETSKATTHADPTYIVDGVVHYCVANMPGAVARTSAFALNNATLPYIMQLAGLGWKDALSTNPHLLAGLNILNGQITYEAVAMALNQNYVPAFEALGG